MNRGDRPLILFGVTASITARTFLRGQLRHFSQLGYDVHLVVGDCVPMGGFDAREGVTVHVVPMSRHPRIGDLRSLIALTRLMIELRPDVIHMGTPKMGLLGALAGWVSRVPIRVFLIHGIRWETMNVPVSLVFRFLDALTCRVSTDVVAVSHSAAKLALKSGVAPSPGPQVLGCGSANGVDVSRFAPVDRRAKASLRSEMGIPRDAQVVAFVGRLTKDKGLQDLPLLWSLVAEDHRWLLLVGNPEPADEGDRRAISLLQRQPRVLLTGHRADVETIFQMSDAVLMLSRREGLGLVLLEAASCETPAVAYAATGVVDAVTEEVGRLVPLGDLRGAATALIELLEHKQLGRRLGVEGRKRVLANFRQEDVWHNWSNLIDGCLARAGRRVEERAGTGGGSTESSRA